LNYRHPDGRFAVPGDRVLCAHSSRIGGGGLRLDDRLEFASGHKLDEERARKVPADMARPDARRSRPPQAATGHHAQETGRSIRPVLNRGKAIIGGQTITWQTIYPHQA